MCSVLAFHGLSISPGSTSDSSVQNTHRQDAKVTMQEEKGENFPRNENAILGKLREVKMSE